MHFSFAVVVEKQDSAVSILVSNQFFQKDMNAFNYEDNYNWLKPGIS